jgi:hypothetical protein
MERLIKQGGIIPPYFFARRADHRAARKFSLYHTRRLFVKQKFAQIFFFKTPEICAYFS